LTNYHHVITFLSCERLEINLKAANSHRKDQRMTKGLTATKPEPSGRFSTAPSLLIAKMICSNDTASAASAASYRYESRVRELQQRFEQELQGVRDAYLQELFGLDLEGT
jgi:hypothetical protein